MAHGTRLYQKPRSPLIHGRSRREQSSLGQWACGLAVALAGGCCVFVLWELLRAGDIGTSGLTAAVRATVLLFGPGAVAGSALGVPVARGFGWRRHWLAVAVIGLLAGGGSTWIIRGVGALLGL